MTTDTTSKLQDIFRAVFELPESADVTRVRQISERKWDSLAHVSLVAAIESEFGFANVSGDWNPLHTDPGHAARTAYRRPVLHGAFSAGLLSRLAGMYL